MKQKSNFGKFFFLWFGELISAIGGGLTSFGLGVYVFNETGSATNMAIVTLLAFLPTLLLSAPAGVLADRYDRRLLMMLGDGLSALGVIYILICMMMGRASLVQICIGVFISSVFSSLIEPAYRATVTDLLTEEEYSKASGMVSIAGSARYLVSPLIAGLLLAVSDIKLLLIIDICTFFLTVLCTGIVKRGLMTKANDNTDSFKESFKEGYAAIKEKRGVMTLIVISSVITLFMGAIQLLSEPLILDFTDSTALGIGETVCALGMLVSSIFLGIFGIKKNYVKVLCASLGMAGLFMVGFSLVENMIVISSFGFMFFFMLPLANNCLDYLVRINIAAEKQGRAWGLIGLISQLGYVISYGCFGIISDGIAKWAGIGVGRGCAVVIAISGVLLAVTSITLYMVKDVRSLENHE